MVLGFEQYLSHFTNCLNGILSQSNFFDFITVHKDLLIST